MSVLPEFKKILKFTAKIKWIIIALFILISILIFAADRLIETSTAKMIYNSSKNIPPNKTGLLLGTSKYLSSGNPNQYYNNRIKAAKELYLTGKIEFIVISGDNSKKEYNEPLDMKNDLIKSGVPENKIFLDYAGFRTYDSVVRMNKIFGQKKFTVISQDFHCRRAVYTANKMKMNAIGYAAKDVDVYNGFKTKVREKLARVKVIIDLFINKQPKFLGEKIEIK